MSHLSSLRDLIKDILTQTLNVCVERERDSRQRVRDTDGKKVSVQASQRRVTAVTHAQECAQAPARQVQLAVLALAA